VPDASDQRAQTAVGSVVCLIVPAGFNFHAHQCRDLRSVQRQIATNWQALYKKVFGVAP
jgi:hypothetical protein